MPPKSETGTVEPEGVSYILNLSTKIVVVGTGTVSHRERDTFKRKAGPSLEEQIRARPKWTAIAEAAAATISSTGTAEPVQPPQPPSVEQPAAELQVRRSDRASAGVPQPRFSDSAHSVRDDYDAQRLGSRHGRVRETNYREAIQQITELNMLSQAWLHEVRELINQCEMIIADLPMEHRAAARAMQEALVEMVGDADEAKDGDGNEGDDGGDGNVQPCAPCEGEPCEREPCEPIPEPRASTEMTEQERAGTAYFARVREEIGWSEIGPLPEPSLAALKASYQGCAGGLLLTSGQLLWVAVGKHFSEAGLRVPLRLIERHTKSLIKSPFGDQAEFVFTSNTTKQRFACGSALAEVELFALEVASAIAAIQGPACSSDTGPSDAPAAPARRQTKQVLAAADLRQQLKQVVALQRSHKAGSTKEAEALLSRLAAGEGKAPSKHTIYKESEHLRDVALGFGGYTLSKRVIEQFLKMPSVQLLLPDALREQQDAASDAAVAKELMAAAKEFFTELFGVGFRGGRRSDEDRNAYAAAMAALLPRDLFAKRGRAASASRLTGLGYRQLHRGCDQRAELEDRACGWRRIKTAEHQDKVNYNPLKEFWHSDLASTPDNQNKDMVRLG
jgi:hypothetical protein